MQEILNKYYEFFISNNFTNKDTMKNDKNFMSYIKSLLINMI